MTPPTHQFDCIAGLYAIILDFAPFLAWQLHHLVGGVMTPPYEVVLL